MTRDIDARIARYSQIGYQIDHPGNIPYKDNQKWVQHALAEARADSAMEGERTFGVLVNGLPVGYLSYAPLNARVAITRGIVFTQAVYGTGVARIAAEQVLRDVFASGIRKLQATYYTHNIRVAAWLRALGAVEEGCLRDQVLQHGRPVSLKVVAIFAPEEPCH